MTWIDDWMEYTAPMATPPRFCKWAGLSLLAGAIERKQWVYTPAYKSNLYPNLYVFLLAPPGVGKTVITSKIREFYNQIPEHKLAPSAVSRASLMDALRDAARHIIVGGKALTFNALYVTSNELTVFLTEYENDFMSTLTDIYDGKPYEERKRGKDINFNINNPQLNIIACSTPASLQTLLPDNAYDHGFMSRVVMVFADQSHRIDLFNDLVENRNLEISLLRDLKVIGAAYGELTFDLETKRAINALYHASAAGSDAPSHPRLKNYNTRRHTLVMKLSIIANAQRLCKDRVITIEDYNTALSWLVEVEATMGDVFNSMRAGSERGIMIDCAHFAWMHFNKTKKGLREAVIIEFLQVRGIPAHSVERIFKLMVAAEMLVKKIDLYYPNKIKDD